MSSDDSIYIQYGKFKAGATGKVAVTFFVALICFGAISRMLGWW